MNKRVVLLAIGFVAVGFGAGAATGYMAGNARMSDIGSMSGLVIRSLCKNEGYVGAYFPLDDPTKAKCATEAEMADMTPTD